MLHNKLFVSVALFFLFFVLFGINMLLILRYNDVRESHKTIAQLYESIEEVQDATPFALSSSPFVLGAFEPKIGVKDGRVGNLQRFFRKHGSELFYHADSMVEISDKYGFDYRLLASIAMQESNLCKYAPHDSYNCWGYGIYGSNVVRFNSYEEAMERVARTLKNEYIDKGLDTPSKIMSKYTPSSDGSWAHAIRFFFKKMEE